jgi:transposase
MSSPTKSAAIISAIRDTQPDRIPLHEPTIVCACHGCDRSKLARLGEDVTEVLEKIPARLKVIRHVRAMLAAPVKPCSRRRHRSCRSNVAGQALA